MLLWSLATLAGVGAALLQYGRRAVEARAAVPAVLRALAATLLVALLLGAPAARIAAPRPDVALDASQSWSRGAAACTRWDAALDSARRLAAGEWFRFGDSLRSDAGATPPGDKASSVRPIADRAAATGRPVIVITDGELDDPAALSTLPGGSRAVVLRCPPMPDVALSTLEVPRVLLAGDTATIRLTLVAGEGGGPAGRVELHLDDATLGAVDFAPLAPFAELPMAARVVAGGSTRSAVLRAVVHAPGDREPRNDTLAVGVDVTRAPAAVFVSTAPDYDAREAIAALRGVTSLPTRAYYRVAPGAWRSDGTLAGVDESTVRAAAAEAPLVVLHGDTSVFGPPRTATHGALLLFAPPATDDGEWFASAAPPSPLAAVLAALPFDSLPPLSVAPAMPRADWQGLIARQGGGGGRDDRRVAVVGWDGPRRIAVLGVAGLWRWRFRGGARADAYGTLMGTLYDWLAGGRTDRRPVSPEVGTIRAGAPLRWRRGITGDSVIAVTVTRRSATGRVHSVTVRFPDGATVAESSPLPVGVYDVKTAGGSAVLVVNPSRELVPRRPTVPSGTTGSGGVTVGTAATLRERGWAFALLIGLLCAEWILRRRVGMR